MKVRPGDIIRIPDLVTVNGESIAVPDPARLTHLQFRRFAGCPICGVHMQSVAARHRELVAAGIHEVVLCHSTAAELATYGADLPFGVVADPDRQLYTKFGVETSLRGVLDPRAFTPVLKATVRRTGAARAPARMPIRPTGGRLGVPGRPVDRPDRDRTGLQVRRPCLRSVVSRRTAPICRRAGLVRRCLVILPYGARRVRATRRAPRVVACRTWTATPGLPATPPAGKEI
jgi:peroxiredoxin